VIQKREDPKETQDWENLKHAPDQSTEDKKETKMWEEAKWGDDKDGKTEDDQEPKEDQEL
jgi:hypothetical protein